MRVDRNTFLDSWGAVAPVAPTKSPKPILANVKFRADEDSATLTATDLEIGVIDRIPWAGLTVERPGTVLLPPRMGEIARTASDDDIFIESDNNEIDGKIYVRCGRSTFTLASEDPDLYPIVQEFTAEAFYAIDAAALRSGIGRTLFATDPANTRYALGGVLWEFEGSTLRLVATDGRRLAMQVTKTDRIGDPADLPGVVVPAKALKILSRLLADQDAPAQIQVDPKSHILINVNGSTVYSRLVEGRFPRYQDVFPAAPAYSVAIEAGNFLKGLLQAAIMTSEESRGVDFAFNPGVLVFSSQAYDRGSSSVEVPIAADLPGPTITLDPHYIAPMVREFGADEPLEIRLIDDKHAAEIRSGESYRYVAMPLMRDH